jgi:hypothetical protein
VEKTGVKDAELELGTVKLLIKNARSSKPQLTKMNDNAQMNEFEAKRQKVAYEGSLVLFERGIYTDAERLYNSIKEGERNKDVYKQIGEVLDQAIKLATAKSYVEANETLARAVGLAKYFLDNPNDRITSSRKQLDRLKTEFQAAVSEYLKQLAGLKTELERINKEDGVDTANAIKALNPLYALFNAKIFDDSIEVLKNPADSEEQVNEQRTYKEVALKYARSYEQVMSSNRLLEHVVGNPIADVRINRLRTSVRGLMGAFLAS